jgi:hypothetical protein
VIWPAAPIRRQCGTVVYDRGSDACRGRVDRIAKAGKRVVRAVDRYAASADDLECVSLGAGSRPAVQDDDVPVRALKSISEARVEQQASDVTGCVRARDRVVVPSASVEDARVLGVDDFLVAAVSLLRESDVPVIGGSRDSGDDSRVAGPRVDRVNDLADGVRVVEGEIHAVDGDGSSGARVLCSCRGFVCAGVGCGHLSRRRRADRIYHERLTPGRERGIGR